MSRVVGMMGMMHTLPIKSPADASRSRQPAPDPILRTLQPLQRLCQIWRRPAFLSFLLVCHSTKGNILPRSRAWSQARHHIHAGPQISPAWYQRPLVALSLHMQWIARSRAHQATSLQKEIGRSLSRPAGGQGGVRR